MARPADAPTGRTPNRRSGIATALSFAAGIGLTLITMVLVIGLVGVVPMTPSMIPSASTAAVDASPTPDRERLAYYHAMETAVAPTVTPTPSPVVPTPTPDVTPAVATCGVGVTHIDGKAYCQWPYTTPTPEPSPVCGTPIDGDICEVN